MFNKDRKKLFSLVASVVLIGAIPVNAEEAIKTLNADNLPINVANSAEKAKAANTEKAVAPLVAPSKQVPAAVPAVAKAEPKAPQATPKKEVAQVKEAPKVEQAAPNKEAAPVAQAKPATKATPASKNANTDDFNFDLKMKSISLPNPSAKPVEKPAEAAQQPQPVAAPAVSLPVETPKDIQYTANPLEALGNSVLSKMDSDLFSQMSEIEKSTTLLTLELRREKIRNEIEAQKAIRQKHIDDAEREKELNRLKDIEKQKQFEAQVLREQQALVDKEQMFELLKQRKLLNAYMNQMLVNQQEWLREKESLYAQIEEIEQEKKQLISMFKQRIDRVLEASLKNIQTAEAAKANFERVVKNLKTRNEQLRKRVEADAKIIKSAKNNLYLKSQTIDELRDKNANATASIKDANDVLIAEADKAAAPVEKKEPEKLSAKYAILGITGHLDAMTVDVIDANGQPITLKTGSSLPTGHIVSEIGSDFVKFNRNGSDEYLYVGQSIDGVIPSLTATATNNSKK